MKPACLAFLWRGDAMQVATCVAPGAGLGGGFLARSYTRRTATVRLYRAGAHSFSRGSPEQRVEGIRVHAAVPREWRREGEGLDHDSPVGQPLHAHADVAGAVAPRHRPPRRRSLRVRVALVAVRRKIPRRARARWQAFKGHEAVAAVAPLQGETEEAPPQPPCR